MSDEFDELIALCIATIYWHLYGIYSRLCLYYIRFINKKAKSIIYRIIINLLPDAISFLIIILKYYCYAYVMSLDCLCSSLGLNINTIAYSLIIPIIEWYMLL